MSRKFFHLISAMLPVSMLLFSCEGMEHAEGYVVDNDTHQPLDSVLCTVLEYGGSVYTYSTGYYNIDGPFGGCVFDCLDMTVEYTKSNYQSQTIVNPGTDSIFLKTD